MNLPKSTEVNKRIYKKVFYENLNVGKRTEEIFVEQVKSIHWLNKLTHVTTNLSEGRLVSEIQIFCIELNQETIDETVLNLIDRGIPYHIIFILKFKEKYKLCGAYKEVNGTACKLFSKYYYTDWQDDCIMPEMVGLTLDSVYENWIRKIAGSEILFNENDIKTDIVSSKAVIKTQKEIARLEKMARNENQPKKKFDIVQQIKKLRGGNGNG